MRTPKLILIPIFAAILVAGCNIFKKDEPPKGPARMQAVQFVDPISPAVSDAPIALRAARNQAVSFAFQLNKFPEKPAKKDALRLTPLQQGPKGSEIPLAAFTAYQVLPMPVDANRAGFVRHTGLSVSERRFPRALLPLPIENGAIKLASLRSPDSPTDPKTLPRSTDSSAPIIWIDIQIPPTARAGAYDAAVELVEDGDVAFKLPVHLAIDDFILPDERHLLMVGRVDWRDLQRLYPLAFRGLQPQMLSRREARYAPAIQVLDEMVQQAQTHRLQLVIPALQPLVKWPFGQPPQPDWSDYDSIVAPWLKGDAFADHVPLGYWPLPVIDKLAAHDRASQVQYFQAAAAHFDAMDWLARGPLVMEKATPGRARLADSLDLSKEAARLLGVHPNLRVSLPLEEEQVQVSSSANDSLIVRQDLSRILYEAPALVGRTPLAQLPPETGTRYLRCEDMPEMPYVGAGADQREVRMWAWLAFVREAQLALWPSVLPAGNDPATPADPGQLVWFYPGEWFGTSGLVPSIHLKWLQRAQQDYEYLRLARQRGQTKRAMTLARLLTKPVELQATQLPDPAYAMLSGTSDVKAWDQVADLLARTIQLSQPGQSTDPASDRQLGYDAAAWGNLQEHPLLLARSAEWSAGVVDSSGDRWLNLHLAIDIYNAADRQPDNNSIRWASVPDAWINRRQSVDVPRLERFSINRAVLEAQVVPARLSPASRRPLKVEFKDGFTGKPYVLEVMAPVARSEKLEGPPPKIDGSLGDWLADDALHEGRLVELLDRPAVQRQELKFAPTNSSIYSSWNDSNFYVGFKVDGADVAFSNAESSFVNYDFRRGWSEDVCEILMQAVYSDNTLGPLLAVAVKPRGQIEISRRLNPKLNANPWQAFVASDIRYFSNIESTSLWRGEVAIPWEAVRGPGESDKRIALLRFNFTQHYGATGQSASWAGPVDYGRDDALMGVLELHQAR